VTAKTVAGQVEETFEYDALGRMTLAKRREDPNYQVSFDSYDDFGNVTSETQTVAGVTRTFTYDYHPAGSLQEANYPDVDGVFAYVRTGGQTDNGFDIRARMYAPVHGVMEDPATGSANAGLGNLLAALNGEQDATLEWNVSQGIEMGRPSRLHVAVERRGGKVVEVRVTGGAVLTCQGQIDVPEDS